MSDSFVRRLGRTLGQLALALLNATLLLIVAALVLSWQLADKVEDVAETTIAAATEQVERLTPVTDQATSLRGQLAELRADVAKLENLDGSEATASAQAILAKLDDLEGSILEMNATLEPFVEQITAEPGALVDRAVETGFAEAGTWIATLRDCRLVEDDA